MAMTTATEAAQAQLGHQRDADDRRAAGAADHLHDHAAALPDGARRPGAAADETNGHQQTPPSQIVLELSNDDGYYAINGQPVPKDQLDAQIHAIYDQRPGQAPVHQGRGRTGSTRTSSRPWTWRAAPGSRSSGSRRRRPTAESGPPPQVPASRGPHRPGRCRFPAWNRRTPRLRILKGVVAGGPGGFPCGSSALARLTRTGSFTGGEYASTRRPESPPAEGPVGHPAGGVCRVPPPARPAHCPPGVALHAALRPGRRCGGPPRPAPWGRWWRRWRGTARWIYFPARVCASPAPPVEQTVTPTVIPETPVLPTPPVDRDSLADSLVAVATVDTGTATGVAGQGPGSGGGTGGGTGGGNGPGTGPGSGSGSGGDGTRGVAPVPRQLILPPLDDKPRELVGHTVTVTFYVNRTGKVDRIDVDPEIRNQQYARKFREAMVRYGFNPARSPSGEPIDAVYTAAVGL